MITTITDWTETWGRDLTLLGCHSCDGVFLVPAQLALAACPYCGLPDLDVMDVETDRPVYTQEAELVLPFAVPEETLQARVTDFAKKSWFAPADLTPDNLVQRLRPLYLPMWLVDARVEARWQAEVGFDYEVVSHREQFASGQWHTQEVRETRIRWEPRVGMLQRAYENQAAPALEEQQRLQQLLGAFDLGQKRPFRPQDIGDAVVHLPSRPPADAWFEARETLKETAAAECLRAAQSDHIRDFRWTADFRDQNWTQLLFPLYTTHYKDDDGAVRMIFLHGQSGRLRGQRRASMKKARRWSWTVAAIAAGIFVLGLLLSLAGTVDARWLPWAVPALVAALVVGVSAVVPLLLAWSVNHFGHFYDERQLLLPHLTDVAWAPPKEK